jgi:hypothetical protein
MPCCHREIPFIFLYPFYFHPNGNHIFHGFEWRMYYDVYILNSTE